MARTIFPFDEINAFKEALPQHFEGGRIKSKDDAEDIIDLMLDIFLLAFANGVLSVNEQFGTDIQPDTQTIQETIYKKVDGATWEDRVWTWYAEGGTEADIVRIAETEAHRDGNAAAYDTAVKAGATQKTWVCQMLPTSRDTHIYLDGTTVPIDAEFYSYSGAHAMYPGQFGVADEDCNCVCECKFN